MNTQPKQVDLLNLSETDRTLCQELKNMYVNFNGFEDTLVLIYDNSNNTFSETMISVFILNYSTDNTIIYDKDLNYEISKFTFDADRFKIQCILKDRQVLKYKYNWETIEAIYVTSEAEYVEDISLIHNNQIAITSTSVLLGNNYKPLSNYSKYKKILYSNGYDQFDKRIDICEDPDLNLYIGYLIGQWIGRGCVKLSNNVHNIILSVPDIPNLISKIENTLRKCDLAYIKLTKLETTLETQGIIQYNIIDEKFRKIIEQHFKGFVFPDKFIMFPDEFQKGFLIGLFQTNGNITFNKLQTKSYITFKIIRINFIDSFINYINNMYSATHVKIIMPDTNCIKISFTNTELMFDVISYGFENGLIINDYKYDFYKTVLSSSMLPTVNNIKYIESNLRSTNSEENTMYNFKVEKNEIIGVSLYGKHIYTIPLISEYSD